MLAKAVSIGLVAVGVASGFSRTLATTAQPRPEPFIPVAVQYAARAGANRDTLLRDLQSIRAMAFNAIETTVRWADAEPFRGKYAFDGLDRVLDAAAQSGLRAIVRVDNTPPEWVLRRYSDGRRLPENRQKEDAQSGAQVCFDHPGIREDLRAFNAAASSHASRSPAVFALDLLGDPPNGFCTCPYTARRVQALAAKGITARDDFLRMSIRDDLTLLVDTARGARSVSHARTPAILRTSTGDPPQDDWLMSRVVDHYGPTLSSSLLGPDRFALVLDSMAGAGRQRGWWMRADASIPTSARRFAGWAAISRGARMLSYADAPARGTFEGVITRNASLFDQLKPVAARTALLYDPHDAGTIAKAHAALFHQNIPVDVVHVEEIAQLATLGAYRALVVSSNLPLPSDATDALTRFAANGGTIVNATESSLSADRIVRLVRLAGVAPAVAIDGGSMIETRFLESRDVLMLVALNYSDAPQKVSMTFSPDTQEAIWQNMEMATGVNFVAGPNGPTYAYWFAPKDVLVLMIRKYIR
ncbi:MAG TPA: beta-galactosidase [Vicinamibacterales bacterium]